MRDKVRGTKLGSTRGKEGKEMTGIILKSILKRTQLTEKKITDIKKIVVLTTKPKGQKSIQAHINHQTQRIPTHLVLQAEAANTLVKNFLA